MILLGNIKSVNTILRKLTGYRQARRDTEILAEVEKLLSKQIAELEEHSRAGHRYHLKRYLQTFSILPKGKGALLDLGGTCGLFDRVIKEFTEYQLSSADHLSENPFNFEKDRFPFADHSFEIVLFMEVLEHFTEDPMHAMAEINRVLQPNGYLLLSTPNITSWKAIHRALTHQHPELFPPFMSHGGTDRHNREYTFKEVEKLVIASGFEIENLVAVDVYDHLPTAAPIPGFDTEGRGDTTFCLARKVGAVQVRMPEWLYWPPVSS